MIHRPHSLSPKAGAAPGGDAFGINFRETLGFPSGGRTDGDIDVCCVAGTPGPVYQGLCIYPTTYTNGNGVTFTAGNQSGRAAQGCQDYNSTWDVRLTGGQYCGSSVFGYYNIQLAAGNWRMWMGWGIHVASAYIYYKMYDGLTNSANEPLETPGVEIKAVGPTLLAANEIADVNGVVRSQADWITSYDTSYFDFAVPDRGADTGIVVAQNYPLGIPQYWDHWRVQELP